MTNNTTNNQKLTKNINYNFLIELQSRLKKCLYFYLIIFFSLFFCSNYTFQLLATPLLKYLPNHSYIIATAITSPVTVPLKISMFLAFIITIPAIFWQLWQFITPALYPREKYTLYILIFLSLIFFALGLMFAYFLVFPIMFKFFINYVPNNVTIMADMELYINFVTSMLIIFGLAFQIPIILIILIKYNFININIIYKKRPYYIIIILIISMLLTPPDVISMLLLAIPLCLLIEISLLISNKLLKI